MTNQKLQQAAIRLANDITDNPPPWLINQCEDSIKHLTLSHDVTKDIDDDIKLAVQNAVNLVYGTISPPWLHKELALILSHSIKMAKQESKTISDTCPRCGEINE